MLADKNKTIENFVLQSMLQVWQDGSEIWTAKHKILKRTFTIKRVKNRCFSSQNDKNGSPIKGIEEGDYERLLRMTNLLKIMNANFAPKCSKILKTQSSTYLIYEEFPSLTLSAYLTKDQISMMQKWQLMEDMAKMIRQTHLKSVIVLGLNPENIYVKSKGKAFFGDWSLAQTISSQKQIYSQPGIIRQDSKYIAEEVKNFGNIGTWSDVFSLGKIYEAMVASEFFQLNSVIKKKFFELISKMVNKRVQMRPQLNEVIAFLASNCIGQKRELKSPEQAKRSYFSEHNAKPKQELIKNQFDTHCESRTIKQEAKLQQTQQIINNKRKHYLTPPKLQIISYSPSQKLHERSSILSLNNSKSNLSQKISRNTNKSLNDHEELHKKIASKRNLCFLLLNLAGFVITMETVPQLCYLLFKQALLTLRSAIQEWAMKNNNSQESTTFLAIMKKQQGSILKKMQQIRQHLSDTLTIDDNRLGRQFLQEKIKNQQLFTEKIIEFAKSMVIYCESNFRNNEEISVQTQLLFKTYLILKKVEEGGYNKFWDKVCHTDCVRLENQKYLIEEKRLGFRYLKGKIANILSRF